MEVKFAMSSSSASSPCSPPPKSKKLIVTSGPALPSVRLLSRILALFHSFMFLLLSPFYTSRRVSTAIVAVEKRRFGAEKDALARRAMAIRRVGEDSDEDGVDEKEKKSARGFSLFVTERGETLFTRSWSPVTVPLKGLIVLMHGLNEHSSRYNRFAKQPTAKGFKVYGMDWIDKEKKRS